MVEAFYRTSDKEEQRAARTEYYSLAFIAIGVDAFVVTQYHVWWDQTFQRPKYDTRFLGPTEEPLTDENIGWHTYREQRAAIIDLGFNVPIPILENPPPRSPISWLTV